MGQVKTPNLRRNLLTQMIGLESMASQVIMPCDRLTAGAAMEDEANAENMGTALLMYFSYSQAWLIPVLRAVVQWVTARRVRGLVWEKTVRF